MDAGVPKDQIYRMCNEGVLERIGRGIYAQSAQMDPTLALVAGATLRQSEATLTLTSALVHHDLSDEIPARTDIALPRGTRPPAGFHHVAWHSFDPVTFTLGRQHLRLGDMTIGVYSAERTIIDVYRLHHLEGIGVASEALRRWVTQKNSNPSSLLKLAENFPTSLARIRQALETLL